MESQSQSTKTLSSPVIPWKTRLQLTIASTVTAASRRENGTINRRLLNILSYNSPPSPTTPINGVTSSDITVDDSRKLWFRLFIPTVTSTETSSLPVMVFFHGGGFVYLAANNKAYDAVCRRFARKMQVIVISVDYRLAPEYKYPAQYDDGFDVLKFIDDEENFRQILPENADLSSCFLAGDSAGGNLAHHVAKRACEAKFRTLKVIGVLAIQPFFGGEERTESEIRLDGVDPLVSIKRTDWMWNAFLTQQDGINRDHEVINVSGPNGADISKLNFPAVFVVVGGFDPLQDWQKRYYEWLKKSGKEAYILEYPNMVHAFYIFPELPESAHIISQMKEFIFNQVSNNAKT